MNTGNACIKSGYWLGKVDGEYTVAQCSSASCEYVNLQCSNCTVSAGRFCKLPPNGQHQCLGNRNGILCESCRDNFSFTFGAVDCVPTANCSGARIVLVPLLITVYLIIIVALLILFLKLDYRISSGYLFCFIYYFSIVDYFFPSNFTGATLLTIVSVCESITQLNPQFLGYTPLCLPKISPIYQQTLLYANPITISLIVVLFTLLAKCCSRFLRFSDSTPVRAICLLLLLSFTALNETSCSLLAFVRFTGIDGLFVKIQPALPYFTSEHIPWFIIAVAVELFLIIPFTVFLFLAPFLMRCFNLTRVKPFLDEFQGCYKDKFRWMAAFYFFCRQIYLLILIVQHANPTPTIYILQLLSLAILIIHMVLQPYRNHWLNLVDTIFLADLLIITLLYGETGNIVFDSHVGDAVRRAVTYILVFIPIIYFICVITVAIGLNFPKPWGKFVAFITCRWYLKKSLVDDEDEISTEPHPSSYGHIRALSNSVSTYREPLLSYLEEEEERNGVPHTRTTRNRITSFLSRREQYHPASYSVVEDPRRIVSSTERRSSSVAQSNVLTGSQAWQIENQPRDSKSEDL